MATPIVILQPAPLIDNAAAVVASVMPGGAGDLAIVGGSPFVAPLAQQLVLTALANESGVTFTIDGIDPDGTAIGETITGPGGAGTAKSVLFYKQIVSIFASAGTAAAITFGFFKADGGYTQAFASEWHLHPFNMSVSAQLFNGSAGDMASVQYSVDDPTPNDPLPPYPTAYSTDANWRNVQGLTSVNATDDSNITYPVQGVRGHVVAGDNPAAFWKFTFIQGDGPALVKGSY